MTHFRKVELAVLHYPQLSVLYHTLNDRGVKGERKKDVPLALLFYQCVIRLCNLRDNIEWMMLVTAQWCDFRHLNSECLQIDNQCCNQSHKFDRYVDNIWMYVDLNQAIQKHLYQRETVCQLFGTMLHYNSWFYTNRYTENPVFTL